MEEVANTIQGQEQGEEVPNTNQGEEMADESAEPSRLKHGERSNVEDLQNDTGRGISNMWSHQDGSTIMEEVANTIHGEEQMFEVPNMIQEEEQGEEVPNTIDGEEQMDEVPNTIQVEEQEEEMEESVSDVGNVGRTWVERVISRWDFVNQTRGSIERGYDVGAAMPEPVDNDGREPNQFEDVYIREWTDDSEKEHNGGMGTFIGIGGRGRVTGTDGRGRGKRAQGGKGRGYNGDSNRTRSSPRAEDEDDIAIFSYVSESELLAEVGWGSEEELDDNDVRFPQFDIDRDLANPENSTVQISTAYTEHECAVDEDLRVLSKDFLAHTYVDRFRVDPIAVVPAAVAPAAVVPAAVALAVVAPATVARSSRRRSSLRRSSRRHSTRHHQAPATDAPPATTKLQPPTSTHRGLRLGGLNRAGGTLEGLNRPGVWKKKKKKEKKKKKKEEEKRRRRKKKSSDGEKEKKG
ncbi:hypothetical protein LINPERHAP1_LOCUS13269 [Linum perenne]